MIIIVPIGQINSKLLEFLKRHLRDVFEREIMLRKGLSVPEGTYNNKRDQFLSEAIIHYILENTKIEDGNKILGVIKKDIYAENLNFIFGQAQSLNGKICLISLARLDPNFYNLPEDENIFKRRLIKEAIHELGHLYGLSHCEDRKCVMSFSNNIQEVDEKTDEFCSFCRHKLKSGGSNGNK